MTKTNSTIDLKRLLSPDKFTTIFRERKDQDPLRLGPVAVELHWTSTCNYQCVHCSYGNRRRSKSTLSPDVIHGIIDDLIELKTEAVYLSGGGEPTTVQGWDTYAEQFLNAGVDIALITNSIAIQDRHLPVLRRMNYIAVSVYSVDKQEYRRITGGAFFERQFDLPARLKEVPHRAVVGARCVLNSTNFRNMVNLYHRVIDAGFDYLIFIPAVDYEQKGVGLTTEEVSEIKALISAHYDEFDLARTNVDNLLKRQVSHYATADYRSSFSAPPDHCAAVSIRGNAFVNYDGSVYLCQPLIGEERYSLGNVNTTRFKDLWNSPRHLEVIKDLNERFARGDCRVCRSIGFNLAADACLRNKADHVTTERDPFI